MVRSVSRKANEHCGLEASVCRWKWREFPPNITFSSFNFTKNIDHKPRIFRVMTVNIPIISFPISLFTLNNFDKPSNMLLGFSSDLPGLWKYYLLFHTENDHRAQHNYSLTDTSLLVAKRAIFFFLNREFRIDSKSSV